MEIRAIIEGLSRPGAYPHSFRDLEVHQTHISAVFLVDRFAYKVKKPVDLDFLDFTTLEKRLHFCREEVRLNRRLAPDVYLGVVPIRRADGELRVDADPVGPDEGVPEAVEYAVKMRRLPDDATLRARLLRGDLTADHLRELARRVAAFHAEAEAGPEISRFGRFDVVAGNARENLEQSRPHVGETLSPTVFRRLAARLEAELSRLRPLIERRAAAGRPRDTPGDLHLEHVYLRPEREPPSDLVAIDCIEFNERFRYADPVAEVAFLTMDLVHHRRRDLADVFSDAYFEATGDEEGRELLPFYVAYRAAVRGKVEGMVTEEEEVPEDERREAVRRARAHWLLALSELEEPGRRPCLILVGGLPATGKSTVARELADRANLAVLSSDRTRKRLAGLDPGESAAAEYGEGIYAPEWTERTYDALLRKARERLLRGERVAVDATFRAERRRRAFLELAERLGVPALFLVCRAPAEEVRRRLARRKEARSAAGREEAGREAAVGASGREEAGGTEGGPPVSDADWEVYRRAAEAWEAPSEETRRLLAHLDTAEPLEDTLTDAEAAVEALVRGVAPGRGPRDRRGREEPDGPGGPGPDLR